jgi:hypothetical protein
MPIYLLEPLIQYLPALQASERLAATTVTTAPHLKQQDYRRFIRALQREAWRMMPTPEPQTYAVVEHNPEKAAQWFAERGFRVVKPDGTVESA